MWCNGQYLYIYENVPRIESYHRHHNIDRDDDLVMDKTYKSMKLSWIEWLSACEQPKSSKFAHDVLPWDTILMIYLFAWRLKFMMMIYWYCHEHENAAANDQEKLIKELQRPVGRGESLMMLPILSAREAFLSECRGRVKAFSSINFMCSLDINIINFMCSLDINIINFIHAPWTSTSSTLYAL